MAAGGIHDQLGGGFARYSVDAEWLVPHFEKMLYDNAQLVQLYLDAYLVSGEANDIAEVVRDILDYVLRDMTHPEGGFYSAEDADSEGHEGKFYCWTRASCRSCSRRRIQCGRRYFGITEQGNFVDHSHPEPLQHQNVLSVVDPKFHRAISRSSCSAKKKMATAREKRVRPHLDDKILASWNGLMLGAMARAAAVLDERRYREAAERNLAFLQQHLWDAEKKTLFHRWRDGERDSVQLLQGYAFLLSGVLDLYETVLNPAHLDFALSLADAMLERFFDPVQGGFWQTTSEAADLILRTKEDYDGAEPSGNSVATLSFLRLGRIAGRTDLIDAAEKTLRLFSSRLAQFPSAVPFMLQGVGFFPTGAQARGRHGRHLRSGCHVSWFGQSIRLYQPNKVFMGNAGKVEPFARTLPDGTTAVAYLCTGTECQAPTGDAAALARQLI